MINLLSVVVVRRSTTTMSWCIELLNRPAFATGKSRQCTRSAYISLGKWPCHCVGDIVGLWVQGGAGCECWVGKVLASTEA